MKAPNKIYIAESLIKKPYGNEWSPTEYVSRENIEYIRKDAILKWAKEQEDKLEYGIAAEAYKLALDMLREKLESL